MINSKYCSTERKKTKRKEEKSDFKRTYNCYILIKSIRKDKQKRESERKKDNCKTNCENGYEFFRVIDFIRIVRRGLRASSTREKFVSLTQNSENCNEKRKAYFT